MSETIGARTINKVENLKAGVNINVQDKDGNTPLMLAISPEVNIVKSLLAYRPDFHIKNNKGQTVFDINQALFANPMEETFVGHAEPPELQKMTAYRFENFLEVYNIFKNHDDMKLFKKEIVSKNVNKNNIL